jgi:hypothetical protein
MNLSILVRSWRRSCRGEAVCQGGSGTRRRPLASHETTAQFAPARRRPELPSAANPRAGRSVCSLPPSFPPVPLRFRPYCRTLARAPTPSVACGIHPGSNATCSTARAAAMPQTQVKTGRGQNLRSDIRARPIRPAAPARRPRARSDGRASSARRRESRRRPRRHATHRD